ncbi:site-specific DNA-methyltransferase [Streptacidiphilus sp. MAP5-52]|uniref:DNA-methyltransferase n=1 Tax=Streptacidiphilus sp. MAP5-52 TaxID=3156267 RepID=UPI003517ECEA
MTYTLHRGDALIELPKIESASVDCVITDPPYNSGGRTAKERTTRSARSKYTSNDAGHQLADFPGENKDQRSYTYWLSQLLAESHRATRDGGVALVFTDWRQLPATADALQAGGWIWRGALAWHKPASRPQKGRFQQSCEFVLWGSKGAIDGDAHPVYLPGLYTASQPRTGRVHITQKPVSVMRELVKIAKPGGTVLDFCAGSGSTGVAALLEGRRFVGIEVTPHYADIAEQRLAQTARDIADGTAEQDTAA